MSMADAIAARLDYATAGAGRAWAGRTILFRHETHPIGRTLSSPRIPHRARAAAPRAAPVASSAALARGGAAGRPPWRPLARGARRPARDPARRPRSRSTSPPARSSTHGTAPLARARVDREARPHVRAALALGPAYRIQTEVLGRRAGRATVWRGDLVLKRATATRRLGSADLARSRAACARGIRRVTGSVLGDESFFDTRRTAPGWKPSYYIGESPPLSALVVDRAAPGARTSTRPRSPPPCSSATRCGAPASR